MSRGIVLMIGSGPNALAARDWDLSHVSAIVAINNAWRVRPDWTHHIRPEDFPPGREPPVIGPGQRQVDYRDYVPAQNDFGGVVYAGGTMAFTAAYWVLARLRPRVLAVIGCDMVYPVSGPTHFYGTGTADPLRVDPTLRSLEAKSARLWLIAARQGCACVNLSHGESRLLFPRGDIADLGPSAAAGNLPLAAIDEAERLEREAGYLVPSGRYWLEQERFEAGRIDAIDAAWLGAFARVRGARPAAPPDR